MYVSEHLTKLNSNLFYEARKLWREKKIFGAWTRNDLVHVRLFSDPATCNRASIIRSTADLLYRYGLFVLKYGLFNSASRDYEYKIRHDLHRLNDYIECIFVGVPLMHNFNLLLSCVCCPPNSDLNWYNIKMINI